MAELLKNLSKYMCSYYYTILALDSILLRNYSSLLFLKVLKLFNHFRVSLYSQKMIIFYFCFFPFLFFFFLNIVGRILNNKVQ